MATSARAIALTDCVIFIETIKIFFVSTAAVNFKRFIRTSRVEANEFSNPFQCLFAYFRALESIEREIGAGRTAVLRHAPPTLVSARLANIVNQCRWQLLVVCHLTLQFGFDFSWNVQHLHKQSAANSLSRRRMFASISSQPNKKEFLLPFACHFTQNRKQANLLPVASFWTRSSLNISN